MKKTFAAGTVISCLLFLSGCDWMKLPKPSMPQEPMVQMPEQEGSDQNLDQHDEDITETAEQESEEAVK